ncbi:hypothetical protein [Paraflavitalea speifideaquila]|uniref:hypothetical protein n=1 Tax=Paraflavitalea speifideaquila TaxID=3076558 RepID=UPI0028E4A75B|nr:hypothetical protein [Paraflavitalea speifideiaquila]
MRLISFFMLVLCMQVAARSEGQTVSLSAKNSKIIEVLKAIKLKPGTASLPANRNWIKLARSAFR